MNPSHIGLEIYLHQNYTSGHILYIKLDWSWLLFIDQSFSIAEQGDLIFENIEILAAFNILVLMLQLLPNFH
jgi:hypothetical protein